MKKTRLFLFVLAIACLTTLPLPAEQNVDKTGKYYEEIEFKKLKKAKEKINGKSVMLRVGLSWISSHPFELEDKGITTGKYVAIELRHPGKTKENEKDKFNAYILKDSQIMQRYQNYGTGELLKKTWKKDRAICVWGTIYYIGGKRYPVAMVLENIEPTKDRPKGNLRYSITVTNFENKSNWRGRWDVGNGFTEIMTNALQQSAWFIVLGDKQMRYEAMREQDLGDSGRLARGKKTPKIGRMTPAQLLVKGAVTHVQHSTTGGAGGLNFRGITIGGSKDHAEINITIYLVDSETGQVKASTNVIGKSGRKGARIGYFGRGLGGLTGQLAGFEKDNVGKACEDAVAQAVDFLIQQLEDIPWEGTIILAKPDKIVINRGQREGVNVGHSFSVGSIEELIDEDTGEVLDVEMTKVGILKVIKVKEKVAYCKAIEGGDKIKKGMTVHPLE